MIQGRSATSIYPQLATSTGIAPAAPATGNDGHDIGMRLGLGPTQPLVAGAGAGPDTDPTDLGSQSNLINPSGGSAMSGYIQNYFAQGGQGMTGKVSFDPAEVTVQGPAGDKQRVQLHPRWQEDAPKPRAGFYHVSGRS